MKYQDAPFPILLIEIIITALIVYNANFSVEMPSVYRCMTKAHPVHTTRGYEF